MPKVWKILNEILKNIIKDMNYNESIKTNYIGLSFLIEVSLKLESAIFYQVFIFHQMTALQKL